MVKIGRNWSKMSEISSKLKNGRQMEPFKNHVKRKRRIGIHSKLFET